jgi:hypothetical protein
MPNISTLSDIPEFSLVKGGPLYRLFRAAGLCDGDLEPAYRRIVAVFAVTWLPLLVLSILDGRARSGAAIPFLSDIENHVRFLIALPLLLAGETFLQRLLSPRIRNFVTRNIIREADLPKFRRAIESASKLRDSRTAEVLLIVGVYAFGSLFYGGMFASASTDCTAWYATPASGRWNLSLSGYWLVFVSLPIFQFIFLRWYFRIAIWFIFLSRVSRLDLNLLPTHSDRTAGLGFLNKCAYAFGCGMMAQGALLAGYIAGQVIHFGSDPRDYKVEAAGLAIMVVGSVLIPLTLFAPRLIEAKWERGGDFGSFASNYVEQFDSKWVAGKVNPREEVLGTSDLQSLADLGNSHAVIDQTRTVPFSVSDLIYLVILTLAPLTPLLLFVFSLEELLDRLVKILM